MIEVLSFKIKDIRLTRANPDYEGSITIDRWLMKCVGAVPYQKVQVLNADNGARIETYIIPGEERELEINGPACHLFAQGDKVMVLGYKIVDNLHLDTTTYLSPIIVSGFDYYKIH
jgi:aspartate 1-decarboxylase